ncbi:hypothetical protein FLA_3896 [Filimonas lacunae]|nr:hypothetical protein FLA_3896 [Filimonas lacunae]
MNFCHGCVLRTQADGEEFCAEDYEEVTVTGGAYWKSKKDDSVFMGTWSELEVKIKGEETWLIAGRMMMQYIELHP